MHRSAGYGDPATWRRSARPWSAQAWCKLARSVEDEPQIVETWV